MSKFRTFAECLEGGKLDLGLTHGYFKIYIETLAEVAKLYDENESFRRNNGLPNKCLGEDDEEIVKKLKEATDISVKYYIIENPPPWNFVEAVFSLCHKKGVKAVCTHYPLDKKDISKSIIAVNS